MKETTDRLRPIESTIETSDKKDSEGDIETGKKNKEGKSVKE